MSERLTGKTAIVTGAASGIGRATALRFAREGAQVVLADRDAAALAALCDEIAAHTERADAALAVPTDVTRPEDAQAVVDAAREAGGRLDILVNSAGITRRSVPAEADALAAWDQVMAVNVRGTLIMCQAAAAAMRPHGGSIVNLGSVMSFVVYDPDLGLSDGFNPYPHGKGAVVQMTRDLGVAMARDGIRVNAVCPGFVYTGLTDGIVANPPLHDKLIARHPIGRLGEADEIASVILFLASDEASFVTAAAWTVDGGYTAV